MSGCWERKEACAFVKKKHKLKKYLLLQMEYPSHRLILCASSDVFQCMLMNPSWTESRETKVILKETQACANCFEDFLKYFYTGKIQLDFTKIIPLVSLADKYNVCDLLKLGLNFMARNVSIAAKRHQLITWYQFAADSGRHELAENAAKFIKANFEKVSQTVDFGSLAFEQLMKLVQTSDIVVQDEMTFFQCIYRWIQLQRQEMEKAGEESTDLVIDHYVQSILPHIRFPMMTPSQLAHLLLNPLSVSHMSLLVERLRIAVAYHEDKLEEYPEVKAIDPRFFTPRLYTIEKYCASISVDHFHNLQYYHCRSLVFSTQRSTQEKSLETDEALDWVVDVYPKGVWFQRCMTVYRPSGLELPERILKTVRVAISTASEEELRVRIGLLVVGLQDGFEHIRKVACRNYIFSVGDQILNFDDLVDYDDLDNRKTKSNFLSGSLSRDSFKLHVVIVPLTKLSTLQL